MATPVHVTACDNELYITASTFSGSAELLHIKSGNNDPVSVEFNLESVLPSGTYDITFIGINWGGPYNFAVSVGGTSYGPPSGSGPAAAQWTQTIQVAI